MKFVAHVGDVATQTIKRRKKLVGVDVIYALEDTELATLGGPQFLSAITGFSATSSTAEQLVSGYLTEDRHRRAGRLHAEPDGGPSPP